MAKLDVRAFGISLGIVVAALILFLGTLNMIFYWGSGLNRAMAIIYPGCNPTVLSVILNSIWGFVYAFIVGAGLAWLYNTVVEENRAEIEKKIKIVARSIWESKGRPENSSADDWREAEKRVKGV